MDFDFGLVASWSDLSVKQMVAWGHELQQRDLRVALFLPTDTLIDIPDELTVFSISSYIDGGDDPPSTAQIEKRHGIPSLDHLAFTEREAYSLTRREGLTRATLVAEAIHYILGKHSFGRTAQIRGPEMHRLVIHYTMKNMGKPSIWAGFSPFENTFALQTSLDGSWDTFQNIPFHDISPGSREDIKDHIRTFRDQKKYYSHGRESGLKYADILGHMKKSAIKSLKRRRPGSLPKQLFTEAKSTINETTNKVLYPSVKQSQRHCEERNFVFFPLQYPIESRLTLFSPQYYRQEYLIELLSRVLPSSFELFVKAHPQHPGVLSPNTIRKFREPGRVQFLHPELSAHVAIENAAGVVVTNNTVGFQTIYYRKPLFTLGNAFYSDVSAAINVEDLANLPETFQNQLSTHVPEESTVSSIYSLSEASFPGDRHKYDEQNVVSVIDSLLQFVSIIE